ncbi:MAG: BolA family protein [Candidatus Accumulibacter sp. UW26]
MSEANAAAADVATLIAERLAVLTPSRLEILDQSALHAGHAGAAGGGGHYQLLIVAAVFSGQPRLVRHRLVHGALGDLMRNRIHALSIQALAPAETSSPLAAAS